MPERASSVPDYRSSTYAPVAKQEELTAWWGRVLPGHQSIYLPFKVLVLASKLEKGHRVVRFNLAREEGPSPRQFEVTLPTDPDAWPDLPSTAQFVETDKDKTPRYGFLFLTMNWAKRNSVDIATLAESTGGNGGNQKWPPAGFAESDPDTARVVDAMGDPRVRARLLASLDDILKSTP